jgi:hypothetical protein
MTAYPKMANIDNILPILVIFCKEIAKHFGCDIFGVFYIQKTYFYVMAYRRCPQAPLFYFPSWHFCAIWKDIQLKLTCLSYKISKSFKVSTSLILPSYHCDSVIVVIMCRNCAFCWNSSTFCWHNFFSVNIKRYTEVELRACSIVLKAQLYSPH